MSLEGISDRLEETVSTRGGARHLEPVWSPAKRIAFRFAFAIAVRSLFIVVGYLGSFMPEPISQYLYRTVLHWNPLDADATMSIGAFIVRGLTGGGSTVHAMLDAHSWGSPTLLLWDLLGLFVFALLITILWTVLDRRRKNYTRLFSYMWIYLRYAVGLAMLVYAWDKVIPNQFGILTPGEMLQPLGQLSHFWLLWDFMAASPAYTVFTGLVEMLGATLLFFPRTTLLGSLILLGGLTNVVAIDLGYTINALPFAFLLWLLDVILVAPHLHGLCKLLLGFGHGSLPAHSAPASTRWFRSPLLKAVLLCIPYSLLLFQEIGNRHMRYPPPRPVWGLFDVASFVRNGQAIIPLASDGSTWQRVGTDGRYDRGELAVRLANGDVRQFRINDDVAQHLWTLDQWDSKPVAKLKYLVQSDGNVALDGTIGSDTVHLLLHPVDMNKAFPLLTQ